MNVPILCRLPPTFFLTLAALLPLRGLAYYPDSSGTLKYQAYIDSSATTRVAVQSGSVQMVRSSDGTVVHTLNGNAGLNNALEQIGGWTSLVGSGSVTPDPTGIPHPMTVIVTVTGLNPAQDYALNVNQNPPRVDIMLTILVGSPIPPPPPNDPVTFTISPTTFTYTGSSQGPTITGVSGRGYTLTPADYSVSGVLSDMNVSSHAVRASATGTNPLGESYTGSSRPIDWSITPAPVMYSLSPTSFTYDGSAKSPSVVASGNSVGLSWNTSGALSGTNAGTYSVTVTTADSNHSGNSTLSWTINKASQSIGFANPGAQTYGTTATVSATATSGLPVTLAVTSGPATLSGSTLTFTDVGNVTVTASQAGSGNYSAATPVSQTFAVNTRPIAITLAGSKTYDAGTSPNGATASLTSGSLAAGDSISYAFANTPSANVGTYGGLVTPTISAGANSRTTAYSITQPGTYSINRKPVTFSLSGTSFSYNGSPQGPSVLASDSAATFATGGTLVATVVNSYTATAAASGNFSGTNNALTWNITKAAPGISITPSQATSTAGTPVSFTANAGGSTGAYLWGGTAGAIGATSATSVTCTTPGSYTVTVSNLGDANYSASGMALATLTITNTPPTSALTSSASSITLGHSFTLTAIVTDPDANLASQTVDVSSDNVNWTGGWSNWAGPTAWNIAGALDTRSITFTPTAAGTWYFRCRGTDAAGESSAYATVAVAVTEPAPSVIKVVPKGSATTVQDSEKTKHTQIRVP